MDKLIGRKLEQYQIEAFIGKGKTGVVYKARDLNLDRAVAIKILSSELAIHPGVQKQVADAARAVSHLTHPSIVALYDFGKQDGRAYVVAEYVKGISLDKAIFRLNANNQFMPIDEALHISSQVAEGLGTAHQEGTLHLNIKPSNLLVKRRDRKPRPQESSLRGMLTDFGMALIPESGIQSAFIDLSGNYAYMSPEQCTGGKIDGRSDIYSLGIILYQLLAGRLPFVVNSPTEAIMRHAVETPLPLADIRPNIPSYVSKIVHASLAKDPDKRFQQAEHLADTLRQAISAYLLENEAESTKVLPPRQKSAGADKIEAKEAAVVAGNAVKKAAVAPGAQPLGTVDFKKSQPAARSVPRNDKPAVATPAQPTPVRQVTPAARAVPEAGGVDPMPVTSPFDTPVIRKPRSTSPLGKHEQPVLRKSEPARPPTGEPARPDWLDTPDELLPTPPPIMLKDTEPVKETAPIEQPAYFQPSPTYAAASRAAAVVAEPDTEVSEIVEVATDGAKIIIIRQGHGPRQVVLNQAVMHVGRAQDNDIVLNARDISRYHLRFEYKKGLWLVTDLDSSAGTFWNGHRLLPNKAEYWEEDTVIQVGSYYFHWATSPDLRNEVNIINEPKTELFQVPETASQVQSSHGRFSVAMHPALISLAAGEQTTVQLELFNQGSNTDTIKLAVRGLPSGTYSLTQHFVTLAPGARAMIPLVIQLPASGTLMSYRIAAGNYPFEMLFHSKTVEGETAVISGMLIVGTIESFSIGIWPSSVANGNNIRILIRNEGNISTSYSLVGRDEKGSVQFGGQRGRLQLKPGEALTQVVTVRTQDQPLLGREHEIPFEVEVRTENGQQKVKTGQIRVKPQIPGWALVLSTIIFTLLLTLLLVTAVLNQGQTQVDSPPSPEVTPASVPISAAPESQSRYYP